MGKDGPRLVWAVVATNVVMFILSTIFSGLALQYSSGYGGRASNLLFPVALAVQVALGALIVDDDGKGFDPGVTKRGSGTQNMEDRLDALGGSLDVRSAVGAGTTLAGRLPIAVAEEELQPA